MFMDMFLHLVLCFSLVYVFVRINVSVNMKPCFEFHIIPRKAKCFCKSFFVYRHCSRALNEVWTFKGSKLKERGDSILRQLSQLCRCLIQAHKCSEVGAGVQHSCILSVPTFCAGGPHVQLFDSQ